MGIPDALPVASAQISRGAGNTMEDATMRQREYLYVSSRTGHYNFCDPSQESVSTYIAVMSPDGSKKNFVNIKTEYEICGNDVDEVIPALELQIRRVLYSTQLEHWKIFLQYLKDNHDDLYLGNLQRELKSVEKIRDTANERISKIMNILDGQGYFENGVWIE
jgi:hypothetical protein